MSFQGINHNLLGFGKWEPVSLHGIVQNTDFYIFSFIIATYVGYERPFQDLSFLANYVFNSELEGLLAAGSLPVILLFYHPFCFLLDTSCSRGNTDVKSRSLQISWIAFDLHPPPQSYSLLLHFFVCPDGLWKARDGLSPSETDF